MMISYKHVNRYIALGCQKSGVFSGKKSDSHLSAFGVLSHPPTFVRHLSLALIYAVRLGLLYIWFQIGAAVRFAFADVDDSNKYIIMSHSKDRFRQLRHAKLLTLHRPIDHHLEDENPDNSNLCSFFFWYVNKNTHWSRFSLCAENSWPGI